MTPTAILETLHARGARLLVVDGNRLAVAPRSAVDDELCQAIRHNKPALLALVKSREDVTADYFMNLYADLFVDLTGGLGTVGDLRAIAWSERHRWPDIEATLRAAYLRCEALAAADDEAGFRHAVACLVELFRAIRDVYAAHAEARDV